MGAIATGSGEIGVAEAGGGDATPIVFLHGVGSDKSVWRSQLDHFGKQRRAVALDYPGYGDSAPRQATGHDDFARAVIEAMDALGIGRAHICGLSLGGVVAIALHDAAPKRCASLIIADSFAVHPDGRGIYERSVAASRDMPALARARVPALVGSAASPELRAELEATMATIDPVAFRQGAAAVWLADQRERAGRIEVPTLVLVGDEDGVTPPALSRELAEMIDSACYVEIAQAGHLANAEQPAAFNAEVDAFLVDLERIS